MTGNSGNFKNGTLAESINKPAAENIGAGSVINK